jgi:putative colanic acid biosynthesis UDP-glucose lipid carrier transferase
VIRGLAGFLPEQQVRAIPLAGPSSVSHAKRAFDLCLASLLLLFLAPLFIAVAAIVRIDSSGPILFRQRRTGLGGKSFFIYKFRTMNVCEDGSAVRQAVAGDPRITRVGRLLRKSSIDELPQILNVLKGDMSLVGPRPHALVHDQYYRSEVSGYDRRFDALPGITGLAQVRGLRGETRTIECMTRRVQADLEYIRTHSLALDFKILVKSALIVFRGSGI